MQRVVSYGVILCCIYWFLLNWINFYMFQIIYIRPAWRVIFRIWSNCAEEPTKGQSDWTSKRRWLCQVSCYSLDPSVSFALRIWFDCIGFCYCWSFYFSFLFMLEKVKMGHIFIQISSQMKRREQVFIFAFFKYYYWFIFMHNWK